MKIMTCKELGGACDKEFTANSFEEISDMVKMHGMEMFQKQDTNHMPIIMELQKLMMDPNAMGAWMKEKKELFDSK